MEETFLQEFRQGRKLERINGSFKKERIKLSFPTEGLEYVNEEIHLLNVSLHLDRELLYGYLSECIEIFEKMKEEAHINRELLCVIETLLLAMDYLTHERFINKIFDEEDNEKLRAILKECFNEEKTDVFSIDANRKRLIKSKLEVDEDGVYGIDSREEKERNRVYMAVFFKKSETQMEYFKQVGGLFQDFQMKISTEGLSYDEVLEGKTKHQLHTETIFHLNRVKNTFCWVLNSCSWRMNEFMLFDEIDIRSKLGIR